MFKYLFILLSLISFQQVLAQTVCTRTVADFGTSSGSYTITGSATLVDSAGMLTLTLSSDFFTDSGPDLYLYLSINDQAPTVPGNTNIQVAALSSNSGSQSYIVPGSTAIDDYDYVTIHCVDFNAFWDGGLLGSSNCTTMSTDSTITVTNCDSYTSPSGNNTWTTTGTYLDTLVGANAQGGDSILTINLTINTTDVSITSTNLTISANAVGASYQWLDCNNDYAILEGEIEQSFTAIAIGNYAVEVTENGCVDTSICFAISTIGLDDNTLINPVYIFPNPNQGLIQVNLKGLEEEEVSIRIYNSINQLIYNKKIINESIHPIKLNDVKGILFLEIRTQTNKFHFKLIQE